MTSIAVKDLKGKQVGERQLSDYVFGAEPNMHVIHQALVRQLANGRAGTASTKTRAEVRGGGRKPWRQKGTGRARAGSIRSPLWEGGGVIFGPKPRDYSMSMNKKERKLALRGLLSSRKEDLVVVSNFDSLLGGSPDKGVVTQPKTKAMFGVLKDLGIGEKKVLLILDRRAAGSQQVERAARNLCGVKVLDFNLLNIKDLAYADSLLVTESVLDLIEKKFTPGCSTPPCPDEKEDAKEAKPKAKTGKAEKPEAAEPEQKAPKAKAKKKTEE